MNYIEENSIRLREKLKRVHNGYKEVLFDEDVFQDTILKVNESLKDNNLPKRFTKSIFANPLNETYCEKNCTISIQ